MCCFLFVPWFTIVISVFSLIYASAYHRVIFRVIYSLNMQVSVMPKSYIYCMHIGVNRDILETTVLYTKYRWLCIKARVDYFGNR